MIHCDLDTHKCVVIYTHICMTLYKKIVWQKKYHKQDLCLRKTQIPNRENWTNYLNRQLKKMATPNGQESFEKILHLQTEVTIRHHFILLRLRMPVGWREKASYLYFQQKYKCFSLLENNVAVTVKIKNLMVYPVLSLLAICPEEIKLQGIRICAQGCLSTLFRVRKSTKL